MGTVVLLLLSNLFMTVAWYGHLRWPKLALWQAIVGSWLIALFEYMLHVPANRYGHQHFSLMQLKCMQEVLTLVVFTGFAWLVFGETPKWNHFLAYGLLVIAVGLVFLPSSTPG